MLAVMYALGCRNWKKTLLACVISLLCITGAFSVGNSIFNIGTMLFFGILGFLFNKVKLPHSPLILAVVLGAMMERSLYQSLVLPKGSYAIFFSRPICMLMLVAAFFFAATPFFKKDESKKNKLVVRDRNQKRSSRYSGGCTTAGKSVFSRRP